MFLCITWKALASCALSNLLLQIGTLRHCGFAIDKRKKEESSLGAKCRTDRIELGQRLNSWTMMRGREVEADRASGRIKAENSEKGRAQGDATGGSWVVATAITWQKQGSKKGKRERDPWEARPARFPLFVLAWIYHQPIYPFSIIEDRTSTKKCLNLGSYSNPIYFLSRVTLLPHDIFKEVWIWYNICNHRAPTYLAPELGPP